MMRFSLPALFLALSACGNAPPPVETPSSSTAQLFRGGGGEVRLRCGSDRLRARLSQGQIVARVDGGDSKVLVPVEDPRAQSGQAYSDGSLTLYKLPRSESWALADGPSGAAECRPETGAN